MIPLAKVTCCIRVSLVSMACPSTWLCAGSTPTASRQHPDRVAVTGSVVSLRQSASGLAPGFCGALGGMAYRPTRTTALLILMLGCGELSELVLVRAQTIRSVDVPLIAAFTSSAAFELKKNSVPLREALESSLFRVSLFGATAGHTVKPAWFPRTMLVVSIWLTSTVAAPEASARFEKA